MTDFLASDSGKTSTQERDATAAALQCAGKPLETTGRRGGCALGADRPVAAPRRPHGAIRRMSDKITTTEHANSLASLVQWRVVAVQPLATMRWEWSVPQREFYRALDDGRVISGQRRDPDGYVLLGRLR